MRTKQDLVSEEMFKKLSRIEYKIDVLLSSVGDGGQALRESEERGHYNIPVLVLPEIEG